MCLSWFSPHLNGVGYFAQAGGGGGYYCEIRIYPEQSLGSVIMFNRTGIKDERYLDKVDKHAIETIKGANTYLTSKSLTQIDMVSAVILCLNLNFISWSTCQLRWSDKTRHFYLFEKTHFKSQYKT